MSDTTSDLLSCAMDENSDLKARILRLEHENTTLLNIIESVQSALALLGRVRKPAPLVASDEAAGNLIRSGIFKAGAIINVGQQEMFVSESGQLKPVKYYPGNESFKTAWDSREFFKNDLQIGDVVSIGSKLYKVVTDGGLNAV